MYPHDIIDLKFNAQFRKSTVHVLSDVSPLKTQIKHFEQSFNISYTVH